MKSQAANTIGLIKRIIDSSFVFLRLNAMLLTKYFIGLRNISEFVTNSRLPILKSTVFQ